MSGTGGIFNIIQRGQLNAAVTAHLRADTQGGKSDAAGSTNPLTWSLKRNESAVASYWRLAPEDAVKNAPSLEVVKRLEKMADDDNSDIAAEKLRQAKAKLDGLRRQLQMLMATGDVRQLRRIAAEAASLAREIGAAARSMAQGIGASAVSTDASSAQAMVRAAHAAARSMFGAEIETADETDAAAPAAKAAVDGGLEEAGSRDQSFKALHELNSAARNAVVEAKGIIALAAQIARSRRRAGDDDDDRYFRALQAQAEDALLEIDAGQREALSQLFFPDTGLSGDAAGVICDSTSIEITIETAVIAQTRVEVLA
ncbi:hypothetical protein [Dongia sp.]|uniref:hypothetical protein n=1 Tax=Dongia sp. TaxID=1977262 RepID=UPI0035AEBD04